MVMVVMVQIEFEINANKLAELLKNEICAKRHITVMRKSQFLI
jgi:hypothetical protein